MRELAIGWLIGFAVGVVVWLAARPIFEAPAFRRTNYRGHELATGTGVLLPLAFIAVVGVNNLLVFADLAAWEPLLDSGMLIAPLVIGFAMLGLLDDIAGVGQSGGFKGHLRAASRGQLTTGFVKLVGAPLVVLCTSIPWVPWLADGEFDDVVRAVAIICLAANLANLLDRAPGRTGKVGQAAFFACAIAGPAPSSVAAGAVVMGAAASLLPWDLREDHMLGDAGSNVIGGVVGVFLLFAVGDDRGQWIVAGVLLGLNLLSEFVSFTKVIDATPPLRWLDRLGAPHRR